MSYLVRKSLTASNTSHQSSMLLVCLWANGDHANQDVFTWNWKPHEQLACLFSEAVFISCQVNHINEIFNLLLMSEPFVHLFDELNWWGGKSQLKFVSRYNNRAKKHFNCFLCCFYSLSDIRSATRVSSHLIRASTSQDPGEQCQSSRTKPTTCSPTSTPERLT